MIGFTTEDKVIDGQNDWSFKPKFSLDRYPEHNFIKGEEYLKQKYGSTYRSFLSHINLSDESVLGLLLTEEISFIQNPKVAFLKRIRYCFFITKNNKWGVLDEPFGKIIVPPIYDLLLWEKMDSQSTPYLIDTCGKLKARVFAISNGLQSYIEINK